MKSVDMNFKKLDFKVKISPRSEILLVDISSQIATEDQVRSYCGGS